MKEKLLAQSLQISGQPIQGPLDSSLNNLGAVINRVVGSLLIPVAAVILFLIFIWGGYDFMMSGGDPARIKSARAKITAGIIGFILLIAAYVIVRLISYIFGLGGGIF
ncbi:MAG: hypothetical protein RI947_294 [Candidatus Parcubacteria bacterium]|jgi:TRAP-type C4-dicarboxylate transport system permease small subunit